MESRVELLQDRLTRLGLRRDQIILDLEGAFMELAHHDPTGDAVRANRRNFGAATSEDLQSAFIEAEASLIADLPDLGGRQIRKIEKELDFIAPQITGGTVA